MRTQIKVEEVNLRQWEYIRIEVPVDGREFLPGESRACVVFICEACHPLVDEELHVEMGMIEFTALMSRLQLIGNETVAIPVPTVDQAVAEADSTL